MSSSRRCSILLWCIVAQQGCAVRARAQAGERARQNYGEHGRELITVEVALRLLAALADPSAAIARSVARGQPAHLLKHLLHSAVFKVRKNGFYPTVRDGVREQQRIGAGGGSAPRLLAPLLRGSASQAGSKRCDWRCCSSSRAQPRPLDMRVACLMPCEGYLGLTRCTGVASARRARANRSCRWRTRWAARRWSAGSCASARTAAAWTPTATGRCTGASRRRTTTPRRSSRARGPSGARPPPPRLPPRPA